MKKKIIILTVGFILALLGAFGAYSYIQSVLKPVTVYEAKETIERGSRIKEESLKEKTIYRGNADEGYILEKKDVIGKFAKYDFAKGDKIRAEKLSDNLDVTSIYKEVLKRGEVAIAVKVDLERSVGGIIKKGDFVNVIAKKKGSSETFGAAKTILQHIEVLHIVNKQGESLENKSDPNQTYAEKTPDVVVLKVKQEEEALVAVHKDLSLSLNPKDYVPYESKAIENIFDEENAKNNVNVIAGGM